MVPLNKQFHVTRSISKFVVFQMSSGNNEKLLSLMIDKTSSIDVIKHSLRITYE